MLYLNSTTTKLENITNDWNASEINRRYLFLTLTLLWNPGSHPPLPLCLNPIHLFPFCSRLLTPGPPLRYLAPVNESFSLSPFPFGTLVSRCDLFASFFRIRATMVDMSRSAWFAVCSSFQAIGGILLSWAYWALHLENFISAISNGCRTLQVFLFGRVYPRCFHPVRFDLCFWISDKIGEKIY